MFGWTALVVAVGLYSTVASGEGEVPQVVTRSEWNAKPANGDITAMDPPLRRAVIAHTAGVGCDSDESCAQQMRSLQQYQMDFLKFSDISYHYLIGGNGRIYEGRSPNQRGAFAGRNNDGSLGIAFIGNFDEQTPTAAALENTKLLLKQSVQQNHLVEKYELLGHRQLSATKSPGDALYSEIKQWPHWSNTVV